MWLIVISCAVVFYFNIAAQEIDNSFGQDTIGLQNDTTYNQAGAESSFTFNKPAYKHALFSGILPGAGQFKNKQYAKAAFFPISIATSIIAANRYNKDYWKFYNAYTDKINDLPVLEYPNLNQEDLRLKKNDARRNRNIMITTASILYTFNIFDAYVGTKIKLDKRDHSPLKAAWRSAVLPGWGQAYNQKYWKIPVVYAGFGVCGFYIERNYRKQKQYRDGYINRNNPNFVSKNENVNRIIENFDHEILLDYRETFLRYLEISVICTSVWYFINILDATVDAHLYDFDISDDLSLEPWYHESFVGDSWAGLSLRFKFN